MEQDSGYADIDALRKTVDAQHRETFAYQAEMIQHIQDVKAALKGLFEKVVAEQHAATKLFTTARDAIEAHNQHASDEGAPQALRDRLGSVSTKQTEVRKRLELYRHYLTQAESVLQMLTDSIQAMEEQQEGAQALESSASVDAEAIQAAQLQVSELESQLGNANEKINSLQSELDNVQEELAVANANLTDLDEQSRHMAALQAELIETRGKLKAAELRVDEGTRQLELIAPDDGAVGELKAKLKESEQEVLDLRAELKKANDEIAEYGSQFQLRSEADAELRNLHDKISVLEDELHDAETRSQSSANAESSLAAKLSEANKELESARRELEAAQNEVAQSTPTDPSDMAAELASLRPLRNKVRQLEEKTKNQEIRIHYLLDEKEKAVEEAHIVTARSRISRELEQYKVELKTAEKRIRDLEKENSEFERELEVLKSMKDSGAREDLKFDDDAARQQLGDLLVSSGVITQAQLNDVIAQSNLKGGRSRIGSLIVQKGYATEDAISQALAHQMKIAFVRIKYTTVQSDAVHQISGKMAAAHNCIPISVDGDVMNLAMANPMDLIAIENIERATGFRVVPHLATLTDINNAMRLHYANVAAKR